MMPVGFALVLIGYSLTYVGVWRLRGDQRTLANIAKGVGAPVITSPGSNSPAAVAAIGANTAAAVAKAKGTVGGHGSAKGTTGRTAP